MKRYFKFLKFCYEINRKVVLIHIFLGILSVFTPYLYIKVFSKYRFEILFKYLLGEDLQIIVCKKID